MTLSKKVALVIFLGILISIIWSGLIVLPLVDLLMGNGTSTNPLVLTLVKLMLLIILVVVPMSWGLWYLTIKLTLDPVIRLSKITKIIADGKLNEVIPKNSKDELGLLGQNIEAIVKNSTEVLQDMANSLRFERQKEFELSLSLKQLSKEKAKIDILVSSMRDAVVGIDKEKKVFLFNKSASEMTGHSVTEVLNKPYNEFLKFVREKDKNVEEDLVEQAFEGTINNNQNHFVITRKDGGNIPISFNTGLIFDTTGINGVVIVLRDVTSQRQLDKLKDEFISVASHELRTPMTAIKGLISMIFEGDFGEINSKLKDPLGDIASSTDRLLNLVADLLSVSKIEAGRVKIGIDSSPINKLVEEVVREMRPLASQKNLELELRINCTEVIRTDPDKVKEILNNLIGNAIKFTDSGKISIEVKRQESMVEILVQDTGLGISKEDQAKLFVKFTQIKSSQLGRPQGTGLGLYISNEFARKLGGKLWIAQSEEGTGSTFVLSLPLDASGHIAANDLKENQYSMIEEAATL